jgi:hypothetical protein
MHTRGLVFNDNEENIQEVIEEVIERAGRT